MKTVKILMLEDNEADAGLIKRVLEKANINFETIIVDTKEEFLKGLKTFNPDVIFSDHSLPQFNSLEAFETLKDSNLNIPFILVTGIVSEEFALKCLKEGVDDFILKDNLYRLPIALENAISKRKLESEKHLLKEKQIQYIEKLKAKNSELIKLNYELDRFVYSTSHELKTPLTSILGVVYLIESEISRENYESLSQYLELIEQSINKLIHTIEDTVHYSANNHSVVHKEKIDAEILINSIWDKLKHMDKKNRITKKVRINKYADWYSDKSRMFIILENLLSNAIKFHDGNKSDPFIYIDITISKDKVLIKVKDNGRGISEKNIGKIFNMFYRASNIGDGSGLGLYLVKETIQKLKGTIDVHSALKEGTTFTIALPNNLV